MIGKEGPEEHRAQTGRRMLNWQKDTEFETCITGKGFNMPKAKLNLMRVGLGNEEEADPVLMIGGDKDTGDVINTTGGQEKFAMSN